MMEYALKRILATIEISWKLSYTWDNWKIMEIHKCDRKPNEGTIGVHRLCHS